MQTYFIFLCIYFVSILIEVKETKIKESLRKGEITQGSDREKDNSESWKISTNKSQNRKARAHNNENGKSGAITMKTESQAVITVKKQKERHTHNRKHGQETVTTRPWHFWKAPYQSRTVPTPSIYWPPGAGSHTFIRSGIVGWCLHIPPMCFVVPILGGVDLEALRLFFFFNSPCWGIERATSRCLPIDGSANTLGHRELLLINAKCDLSTQTVYHQCQQQVINTNSLPLKKNVAAKIATTIYQQKQHITSGNTNLST